MIAPFGKKGVQDEVYASGATYFFAPIITDWHTFEALVFPEHAESESYELGQTRISKFYLREQKTRETVCNFDRGWDIRPTTPAAQRITDLLTDCLAEHVFGT